LPSDLQGVRRQAISSLGNRLCIIRAYHFTKAWHGLDAIRLCRRGKHRIMRWLMVARGLAWVGAVTILISSVVPADERPVTGLGQAGEHVAAFGLVAGMFAVGNHRLGLIRLLLVAFLFCGSIELLQVPLPTRHARVSDFAIDLLGSFVAIAFVMWGSKFMAWRAR
jgi:hypothetical protein